VKDMKAIDSKEPVKALPLSPTKEPEA